MPASTPRSDFTSHASACCRLWGYAFAVLVWVCPAVVAADPLIEPPTAPVSKKPTAPKLYPVVDRGRVGYIDRSGTLVVPLSKPSAGRFVRGLAPMRKAKRHWVFVDQRMNVVIPGPFRYARPFEGTGGAAVQVGDTWGIVALTGAWLVRPTYERIYRHSEGAWTVRAGGKWGMVDMQGRWLIPARYDFLAPPKNGWALAKQAGRWFWVDRSGKVALQPKGDVAFPFAEGLSPMRVNLSRRKARKRYRWGYIDRTGKLVIPAVFVRAHSFSEGLAEVETDARMGFKFGYADKTGKVVIAPQWHMTGPFKNGRAMVQVGKKFGFIDTTGKVVIPARFDEVSDFDDGLAYVEMHSCAPADMMGGKCSRNRTDRGGWIDTSGAFVWKPTLKR